MKSSIALSILVTLIFDFLVASNSVVPFRFIYDLGFLLIIFTVSYTAITLWKGKDISQTIFVVYATNKNVILFFSLLPILINLKAIVSIISLDVPRVGLVDSNILVEGYKNLFPLLEYIAIILVNAILLYVIINRKGDMDFHEIPAYALGIIALETCLAIYSFHIGGILGIRFVLLLFHIVFCGLVVWLYHKGIMKDIHIKISYPDVLLLLFSLGILVLVYFPFGIYSQFQDNAVILNSVISITQRGSLQPYYDVSGYYPAIGGFLSLTFAYITGHSNIMHFSTIPFLVAYLFLPFVTYHFLKMFITEDTRIAILGTVMAIFMDGLAIVLLPAYIGNLTHGIVTWQIAPATKSLYFSSTKWVWLNSYKILGLASAIAIFTISHRRTWTHLFLGGALLFLSFVNPRQPVLAIFLLIFLFGIKKIDLKQIVTLILVMLACEGSILTANIIGYVRMAVNKGLYATGFITEGLKNELGNYIRLLMDNSWLSTILVLTSIICAIILIRLNSKSNNYLQNFNSQYISHQFSKKKVIINSSIGKFSLSLQELVLLGLTIFSLIYIVLHAYQNLPLPISDLINNKFVDPLNYLIMRYHILIVLIVVGFLSLKFNKRILVTFISLFSLTYLMLFIKSSVDSPLLHLPLIIVIIALPSFTSFVKTKKKFGTLIILIFILSGVFSAGLYSSTLKSSEYNSRYSDLPHILNILLKSEPGEEIFTPSTSTYYIRRTLSMANLRMSTDPSSRLYLIDLEYTNSNVVNNLLNNENNNVLYRGEYFILLERIYI